MAEKSLLDLVPDGFFLGERNGEVPQGVNTLSVSEFLSGVKFVIEDEFPYVGVRGEVSSISIPRSGHAYFILKDQEAQLKAVMFQRARHRNGYFPSEGDEVVVFGRPTVYRPRGDLQIIVDQILPYGEGVLERQFNELKERLEREGLFAPENKKELPGFPGRVFIVTSPTGAALRDFIKTARDRLVLSELVLCPTRVQGDGADLEIIEAVDLVEETASPGDVLVLTRGGGSREDLWTFNSEALARRIFACGIPTISAIGHEVDFTILDFVADVRAQTPTAAAQILFPQPDEFSVQLGHLSHRLRRALSYKIIERRHLVKDLANRLKDPTTRLYEKRVQLDELTHRLERNMKGFIEWEKTHVLNLNHLLSSAMRQYLGGQKEHLARLSSSLDALSPLKVLSRGYAIVLNERGQVIKRASSVQPNDTLIIRPKSGRVTCIAKEVIP